MLNLVTLGNDIRANTDQAVIDALAAGNHGAIRDWYNNPSNIDPSFWVLKDELLVDELMSAVLDVADPTVAYDAIDAKDATLIGQLFANGTYQIREASDRQWLVQIFAAASQSSILNIAAREATPAEKLFAVTATGPGGGDGSAKAQSANLVFSGLVTAINIRDALDQTA